VLTPKIQSLLRRRKAVRDVDPVDLEHVLAEAAVDWMRGGAQTR
jgi:hypothetical protein